MGKPTEGPYRVGTDLLGGIHVYDASGDRLTNDRMNGTEGWHATARLLAKSWEMREQFEAFAREHCQTYCDPRDVETDTAHTEECVEARALLASIDGDSE